MADFRSDLHRASADRLTTLGSDAANRAADYARAAANLYDAQDFAAAAEAERSYMQALGALDRAEIRALNRARYGAQAWRARPDSANPCVDFGDRR